MQVNPQGSALPRFSSVTWYQSRSNNKAQRLNSVTDNSLCSLVLALRPYSNLLEFLSSLNFSFLSLFVRHANSLWSRLETTRIERVCFNIFFSLHRFDFASFISSTSTCFSRSTRSILLHKLKLLRRRCVIGSSSSRYES